MQDPISNSRGEQSPTAVMCEHLALYGGTPQDGDPDTRDVWDRDEAIAGLEQVIRLLAHTVAPDGVQLADERENLL